MTPCHLMQLQFSDMWFSWLANGNCIIYLTAWCLLLHQAHCPVHNTPSFVPCVWVCVGSVATKIWGALRDVATLHISQKCYTSRFIQRWSNGVG